VSLPLPVFTYSPFETDTWGNEGFTTPFLHQFTVAFFSTGDLRREQHVILRASFLVNLRDFGTLASELFVGHIEQALPRW